MTQSMTRPISPTNLSDLDQLKTYVATGDANALEPLICAHRARVMSVCRKTLRNEADASDACQQVFLQLVRHADAIDGHVEHWLVRTARNTCIDLIRSNSARRRREHERQPTENCSLRIEEEGPCADTLAALQHSMAELTADERRVLHHRYVEGRSQADIASELGVSQQAVSKRLRRSCDRLREALSVRGVSAAVWSALGMPAIIAAAHRMSRTTAVAATWSLAPQRAASVAVFGSVLFTNATGGSIDGNLMDGHIWERAPYDLPHELLRALMPFGQPTSPSDLKDAVLPANPTMPTSVPRTPLGAPIDLALRSLDGASALPISDATSAAFSFADLTGQDVLNHFVPDASTQIRAAVPVPAEGLFDRILPTFTLPDRPSISLPSLEMPSLLDLISENPGQPIAPVSPTTPDGFNDRLDAPEFQSDTIAGSAPAPGSPLDMPLATTPDPIEQTIVTAPPSDGLSGDYLIPTNDPPYGDDIVTIPVNVNSGLIDLPFSSGVDEVFGGLPNGTPSSAPGLTPTIANNNIDFGFDSDLSDNLPDGFLGDVANDYEQGLVPTTISPPMPTGNSDASATGDGSNHGEADSVAPVDRASDPIARLNPDESDHQSEGGSTISLPTGDFLPDLNPAVPDDVASPDLAHDLSPAQPPTLDSMIATLGSDIAVDTSIFEGDHLNASTLDIDLAHTTPGDLEALTTSIVGLQNPDSPLLDVDLTSDIELHLDLLDAIQTDLYDATLWPDASSTYTPRAALSASGITAIVPEPGTAAIAALATGLLVNRRRRRRSCE